ncbi:MAG: OmpA family protein [Flavipsychrobacter sp.]|nr:OmpA family protein [Flavipsychrobacter sp.]
MRLRLTYILLVISTACFAQPGDTTRLYFDLDIDSLSVASKRKLDVFIRSNHLEDPRKSVVIIGYTDYLGTEDYNIVLSKERARNVAYYLLENAVQEEKITVCMGRGKIERKGMTGARGNATDRRVDIVVVDKPRKPVVKDTPRTVPRPKDPMDVDIVMKPGQRREPIPEEFRTISLRREAPPSKPKKPGTSYSMNDSGNVHVVMRPGGEKPELPKELQEALNPENPTRADPYTSKGGELDISQVKPGETFVLRNIYFFPQSHSVREESIPEMERLANTLKKYPKLKIQVEGHICCVLDYPDAFDVDAQDNHLSVNRSKYIYEYLLSKGIGRDRVQYAGFGRSRPIVEHERTEEEANKNRRVEIRVLEK